MRILVSFSILLFLIANVYGLTLKSNSFVDNQTIPTKYTCDDSDISPELFWQDVPEETKSFAIICEDPDAPVGNWIHWVIFNIPKEITRLDENIPKVRKLDNGIYQGRNDFGKIGYNGPCPPRGKPHRYFFKIYALDIILEEPEKIMTKSDLMSKISGHIIAEAELVGIYKR